MAGAASGPASRHVRELFGGGSVVGLGDDQLLARYASSGDGAAFEALVARHGPMVLATCRAVLRSEHDVEDAFQATFLVLALKAGSVRAGEALGGWLHRVARRAAVQAGIRARRRLRMEAVAASPIASPPGPDPELRPILHEEIGRLPERHRLPVVLCDLEGLTYEQAAERLRWTEPTLRCRLARARQGLRHRLIRRGITAPAVAALLATSATSAWAVPVALVRSAVAAGAGGAAPAGVMLLTRIILRGMLMTRIKIASTAALAALGLATAGVIAAGAGRPEDPRPAMKPAAPTAAPAVAKDAPPPGSKPGEMIEIRGLVVAPDGKPVEGASVRLPQVIRPEGPGPETTSGPGGQFAISIPKSVRDRASASLERYPRLVATAPGLAPGWVEGIFRGDAPPKQTIALVEPGPAIEGRVVDLEGRPVVGARVTAKDVWYPDGGDLAPWLSSVRVGGTQGIWRELRNIPLEPPPVATTDADGRYRLAGLGRERVVGLLLTGPSVATETVYVMGRDDPEVRGVDKGMVEPRPFVVHAPRFQHAAAPTKPIEGVIRDKDTGRPIAGVMIRGNIAREGDHTMIAGIEAKTDAEGKYRLAGLPRASGYRIFTFPREGLPYLNGMFEVPAPSPTPEPVRFDVVLKRGILIRGRVTDKGTGAPVRASIDVYTLADNPHAGDFPGYAEGYRSDVASGDDGRFEVVALPGRGLLAVRADDARYRGGVMAGTFAVPRTREDGSGAIPTTTGLLDPRNYHTLAGIDVEPGVEATTLDIQVDPGRSLRITAVAPDGRPIGGTRVQGVGDIYQMTRRQEAATFEVHALDPSGPRRVTIAHDGRKLIGAVYLKGDESEPVTVPLRPWGGVAGRVVDDEGRPRPGLHIYNRGGIPAKPSVVEGTLPARDWGGDVVTDGDGRFRIERLVPGLEYGGDAADGIRGLGHLFRGQVVAPGEFKDLGDLSPTRDRPEADE